ncbi:MAG: CCA tRNA nucleotidyltransferase [Nanoarchaeota archaeon]|nr:CCA tRNA nucleotidyltransferase [Nanoarchaeota archaeon]
MRVLDQIKPTKRDETRVLKIIEKVLQNLDLKDAKLELGGSYAKDTWLKGNHDVDVFVRFPYDKYKEKDISDVLKSRLKKYKVVHGSRDYFQIKKGDYVFEFIPVLDIKSSKEAKNITDVSPLHTKWVKEKLNDADQVRLVKKFCKAQGVYGAESYIRGFSGYVLEILTVHYKTFFDLVKNVANWKKGIVVDVEKFYKNKGDILEKLNKDKLSCLVVIDPVQKDRNAAAALCEDKFDKFVAKCKEFMRNPSNDFFVERKISIRDLKLESGENNFLTMKVWPLKGKKDIVGSKLLKCFVYINKKLSEEGFNVINSDWEFNEKAIFWFYVKNGTIGLYKKHYGPPKKEKKHFEEFLIKWKNHEIKKDKDKIYVELKREHTHLKDFVKNLLKSNYVKNNVKKIKLKNY